MSLAACVACMSYSSTLVPPALAAPAAVLGVLGHQNVSVRSLDFAALVSSY